MAEETKGKRLTCLSDIANWHRLTQALPHSSEIEVAILGALISFSDEVMCRKVLQELKADYFYLQEHKLVAKALLEMNRRGDPIDIITVTEHCRSAGSLDRIGGPFQIATLQNRTTHAYNIDFHFRILYQYYIRRRLIESAHDIAGRASNDTADMFDLLDAFTKDLDSCKISKRFKPSRKADRVADDFLLEFNPDVLNKSTMAQSKHLTGHKRFDDTVTISGNKIILLAGGAKHGKSKFVAHFMFELLERHRDVSIFWVTLEDSETDVLRSYLASKVLFKPKQIREKDLPKDAIPLIRKWTEKFKSFDIEFRDQVIGSAEIISQFTQFCMDRMGRFPILVVDNVMSLKDREKYQHDLNGMYDYVMHNLLICRQKTRGLIWVLHHYNDAQQDEKGLTKGYRPRLQDIKGTEAFRRVPNQVLLINNPSKYKDLVSQYHGDQKEVLQYMFILDVGANREDDVSDDVALIHYFCSLDYNLFREVKIPQKKSRE